MGHFQVAGRGSAVAAGGCVAGGGNAVATRRESTVGTGGGSVVAVRRGTTVAADGCSVANYCGRGVLRAGEATHPGLKNTHPRHVAFVTARKQHLFAYAHAQ